MGDVTKLSFQSAKTTAKVHVNRGKKSGGLVLGCSDGVGTQILDGAVPGVKRASNFISVALADISKGGREVTVRTTLKPGSKALPPNVKSISIVLGTKNSAICSKAPEGAVIDIGTPAKMGKDPVVQTKDGKYAGMGLKPQSRIASKDGYTTITRDYYADKNGVKVIRYSEQQGFSTTKSGTYKANDKGQILCESNSGSVPCKLADEKLGQLDSTVTPVKCETKNSCDPTSLVTAKTWYQVEVNGTSNSTPKFGLSHVFGDDPKKCLSDPFRYVKNADDTLKEVSDPGQAGKPVACGVFPSCDPVKKTDGGIDSGVKKDATVKPDSTPVSDGGPYNPPTYPIYVSAKIVDKDGRVLSEIKKQLAPALTATSGIKIPISLDSFNKPTGDIKLELTINTTNITRGRLFGLNLQGDLVYETK
ncbi:MAG: hypothetical protein HQ564_06800 [Candidatus Saganbacteria bacterium]|nr:hypothetical protein [Candidatus Saganbacteria bacterium]